MSGRARPRLDPAEVRATLRAAGLRARHALSQNFLADPDVLEAILAEAAPEPGRRRDPLRDLALDHEHRALRPRRRSQQRVQDRARDVIRQVRDDVVWQLCEPDEVLVERVALDEAQLPSLERPLEPVA